MDTTTSKQETMNMPMVHIHMIEGRTQEQRERIAKAFTDTLVQILGINKEDIWIEFHDMSKTHFATGGTLKSKK
jgi:4-oxalocrotonate tautomerase